MNSKAAVILLLTCADNDRGKVVFPEVAGQTVLQRGNRAARFAAPGGRCCKQLS
jgi:hypothetical protein